MYSRPEFLYYWVYYVGFNLPWVIAPAVLLRDSWTEVERAFGALGEKEEEEAVKVVKGGKGKAEKKKVR